jgi:glycosyltransferase involved in cell wall biosynthesis
MRVTMLVRCLAMMQGGGETRHLAWTRELSALGVDVQIITGRPLFFGTPRHTVDAHDVIMLRSPYARDFVYRYQNRRGFGRLTMAALHADEEWFCRAAWNRIANAPDRPDLVHAHALHQAARLRREGIPVVINLPGAPNARYARDLRMADAVIADGWAADHLSLTIGRAVERVEKGVDAAFFCPEGPDLRTRLSLTDKKVVLTVARLVPIKNLELLVDAMALVRHTVPSAHLLVVGDGPLASQLQRRGVARGVADIITFVGQVPHDRTPAFYRTADLFALSSEFDNSPNAVLEAMASGLPIVTTDVGGIRQYVDEAGGAIVAPNDPESFAGAIAAFLTHSEMTRAVGESNRLRACTLYSWRSSALRLLEIYRRVNPAAGPVRASA